MDGWMVYVSISVLCQIGPLSLLDLMTPREQYGVLYFFFCCYFTFECVATMGFYCIQFLTNYPFEPLHLFTKSKRCGIGERFVSSEPLKQTVIVQFKPLWFGFLLNTCKITCTRLCVCVNVHTTFISCNLYIRPLTENPVQ